MLHIYTFKNNYKLYLDDFCNLFFSIDNNLYLIKFNEFDFFNNDNNKLISFRDMMFKIFNRDEYSKARDTDKKYEIFIGKDKKLKDFILNYSINNENLYINFYLKSEMDSFILIDTEILNFIVHNYNNYLNDFEKHLLSLKDSKIKKISNKSLVFENKVSNFQNKYYFEFNKNSYSLDYGNYILDVLGKCMTKLNKVLIFNNSDYKDFKNNKFIIELKRERNNDSYGEYHLNFIKLNLVKDDYKNNAFLIETVFVHEYAHALDRNYFKRFSKKNAVLTNKRNKVILDVIKNDSRIFESLLYSDDYKNPDTINKIKLFLNNLDNLDEFYNSIYYKQLGDTNQYFLNDSEIFARLFEMYYLDKFYKDKYDIFSKNIFYLMDKNSIKYLNNFLIENGFSFK